MFVPDPGYTIFDVDFSQADARVVAWDSNCKYLKEVFNDPTRDVHDENAKLIYGKLTEVARQFAKNGVHAANYYVKAKTLSTTLGTTVPLAQAFLDKWYGMNPEIPAWHESTRDQLRENGTIHNIYGYRRQYFDRIENKLPEALAWIGQSTVAIAIKIAMNNLMRNLEDNMDGDFQVLMQVHDSIIGQFRNGMYPWIRARIRDEMLVTIPYDDPLVLPVDMKASRISWGHAKHIAGYKHGVLVPWEDEQKFCIH